MSQNDYVIANQTTPLFRSDLNSALQALASNSSGATAPATTYANMLWYDTATNILKMRSEADDAWIDLGTLDQGANTFSAANAAPIASPAFTGVPTAPTAAAATNTTQIATTEFVTTAVTESPSSMEFISTADASDTSSINFTAFSPSSYDAYTFILSNVVPTTDVAALQMRTSTDGGATYHSGASYDYILNGVLSSSVSAIPLSGTMGSAAGEDGYSGTITIYGPHINSGRTRLTVSGAFQENTAGRLEEMVVYAQRIVAEDTDAVTFFMTTGTIESGTITMYGMRNA